MPQPRWFSQLQGRSAMAHCLAGRRRAELRRLRPATLDRVARRDRPTSLIA